MTALRLGVNVDHVATVRNARGALPDPVRAALIAINAFLRFLDKRPGVHPLAETLEP